jgi:uroporphyrinogen-III synthase
LANDQNDGALVNVKRGVIITRPASEAAALAKNIRQSGFEPLLAPMLEIERVKRVLERDLNTKAVVFTSKAAIRAVAEDVRREAFSGISAYCVGRATAALADQVGFSTVTFAGGTSEELVTLIRSLRPRPSTITFFRAEHLVQDLAAVLAKAGVSVQEHVLYRANQSAALSPEVVRALEKDAVHSVLFFSKRAAEAFCRVCTERWRRRIAAICLSDRVVSAIKNRGFQKITVASSPEVKSMLAILENS